MEEMFRQLRTSIEKLMREYNDVYNYVRNNKDWKNSFRDTIRNDIPNFLRRCAKIDMPYKVVGSYGI